MIKAGNRYFYRDPPNILNTFFPETGVKSADLFVPNGTYPQSVNLSNFQGMSLVPSEAETIKVWCHLFRTIANADGATDATISLNVGGDTLMNFATSAFTPIGSGAKCFPPGALIECMGGEIEFPNVAGAAGDWGRFSWSIGGNTVVGCMAWLRVTSFTVPTGYVLPSVWPAKNAVNAVLAMYFGADGFSDSSSAARSVTAHNSSVQPDGHANFNGVNTYLSFDGSDVILSGDFTIEVDMTGLTNAMQAGTQQRVLSFGGAGSPAIGIDQAGGGAILLNETSAILKTGGNSIISGYPTTIKWSRAAGVNRLIVNGQQDGQPFTDITAWTISSSAEVGRLNGHTRGYFTGEIFRISILNGIAV